MATKRLAKSTVDWAKLKQACPPHQVESYKDLKTRTDNLVSKISTLPETLPQINWAAYAKTVPVPGLVDKFKQEYASLNVSFPKDVNGMEAKIKANETEMVANAKAHVAACQAMKTSAEKMKASINSLPPKEELTGELTKIYFPLTVLDIYGTGEKPSAADHQIIKKTAPKMHWDMS
ncbi:ATP synthase, H transporting, mitochondrial Fo complex, subunit d [Cichlidogyrus casuarinus]|uniref:ATP synthase subunit d, mitochondrial n=1 Tax=Cichlidogyrus casuarinus TaxID=1844966 RepID=A0ABD2Q2Z5_9PLAT